MALNNDSGLEDVKDYTKQIWIGVLVVVVLMIIAIAMQGDRIPANSEVTTKQILIQFNKSDPADRARALKRMQDIRQRLVSGENFEELARNNSDDPGSAPLGGLILPQKQGAFEENYEEYAWSAPIGELSEIIQTTHGFHLVIVVDRYMSPADEYEKRLEQQVKEKRSTNNAPDSEEEADE